MVMDSLRMNRTHFGSYQLPGFSTRERQAGHVGGGEARLYQ